MARRKPVATRGASGTRVGSRQTRIRIPQPPDRPFRLLGRDNLRREAMRPEAWWFIQHRRGIRRPNVGLDPLEARAVSKASVVGSLPERIVYKYLVAKRRYSPSADFDFQSSLQGGRLELGGIVADFLFRYMRIILNVQGPTHQGYLRTAKDNEQRDALEQMGYRVFDIEDTVIYSEFRFERTMEQIFRGGLTGPGANFGYETLDMDPSYVQSDLTSILDSAFELASIV